MKYRILQPLIRMVDRWRTARALALLDCHLLEDIGRRSDRMPLDDISIARRGYWTGRKDK